MIGTCLAVIALLPGAAVPALAEVAAAPDQVVPLAPGQSIPSAEVRAVTGEPVDLADLVREQGTLLIFYRGGW